MALETSSPTREYTPYKSDDDDFIPVVEPEDCQSDRESSCESLLLSREPWPSLQAEGTFGKVSGTKRRGPIPGNVHSAGDHETRPEQSAPERGTEQSVSTPTASTVKQRKKPGPRPWVTKPIKKNDMSAKLGVIHEIEGYWGKKFITAYIPKCHRPLTKRTKGKKHRSHEANPKNWLPSILKAILVIAKLTQNKAWLKKAINDVVRYRIKHTGNRKPQLTTTDFDVLEDMLVKGWEMEYSFPIRYKHLFAEGKNQEVDDADIDSILGVRTGPKTGNGDNANSGDESSDSTEDEGSDSDDSADEDEQQLRGSGMSDQYLQHSDCINVPQDHIPASSRQPAKQLKKSKQSLSKSKPDIDSPPVSKQQSKYGHSQSYGYQPPMNPWGHPIQGYGSGPVYSRAPDAYKGSSPYDWPPNYSRYGSYGPSGKDAHGLPQPWTQHGMNQWPPHYPPDRQLNIPDSTHGNRIDNRQTRFSPSGGTHCSPDDDKHASPESVRQSLEPHAYADSFSGATSSMQRDSASRDDQDVAADGASGFTQDMDDETAAIEAELRAAELELKVAQLKARHATRKLQARNR